ncbi:hypothetical protein [Microbacterium sp. ABRD28]|uniref:hypothetical protein n=1 Tax=Microbacterium sp. ABRD28 TaxID=2268461 RepID=UPI000F55031D|nr:hypothetical protein [Microbacterium sp. ABRD28]
MSDRTDEELKLLRERAYGPHADIGNDPSAQQRLRQLEGHAATVEELQGDGIHPVIDLGADRSPRATDTERSTSSMNAAESRRAIRTPAPIVVALTLAAAVVFAAITSATTAALVRAESPYADVQHVTSLPAQDSSTWPSSLGEPQPADKRYADFLGYTVIFRESTSTDTAAGTDCLSVLTPDNAERDPGRGAVVTNCGAAAFPPATTVIVDEASPSSVLNFYRIGTVLQFVQNGSSVDVYADTVLG